MTARSKGRIERLFETLQDRLSCDLIRAGITTPAAGTAYLAATGLARHNSRFAHAPAVPTPAFRPVTGLDLRRILAFRYTATVANDNTVSLGGRVLHIPPGPQRRGYARARVDVRQHLDGTWSVYLRDRCIAQDAATPLTEPLRYRPHARGTRHAKGTREEILVYDPTTHPVPADIIARQKGGRIASA